MNKVALFFVCFFFCETSNGQLRQNTLTPRSCEDGDGSASGMVLAEVLHHVVPRGPKPARAADSQSYQLDNDDVFALGSMINCTGRVRNASVSLSISVDGPSPVQRSSSRCKRNLPSPNLVRCHPPL